MHLEICRGGGKCPRKGIPEKKQRFKDQTVWRTGVLSTVKSLLLASEGRGETKRKGQSFQRGQGKEGNLFPGKKTVQHTGQTIKKTERRGQKKKNAGVSGWAHLRGSGEKKTKGGR